MATAKDTTARFLALLQELSKSNKVVWARSYNDIGFVYCLVCDELVVFEVSGGKGELVDPLADVIGIRCKCRNVSYVWLEASSGFHDLLAILRSAPINDKNFVTLRSAAYNSPVQLLESALT